PDVVESGLERDRRRGQEGTGHGRLAQLEDPRDHDRRERGRPRRDEHEDREQPADGPTGHHRGTTARSSSPSADTSTRPSSSSARARMESTVAAARGPTANGASAAIVTTTSRSSTSTLTRPRRAVER